VEEKNYQLGKVGKDQSKEAKHEDSGPEIDTSKQYKEVSRQRPLKFDLSAAAT